VLQTAGHLKTKVEWTAQHSTAQKTKERWQGKRTHGQSPRNLDEKLVDNEESHRWLKSGDIMGETESKKVAALDQAIST